MNPGDLGPRDEVAGGGRRSELIELTIEVISEEGLNACTFRRLAEKAGTSTRVFTYEFGSRNELLRAALERTWEMSWPGWKEIGNPDELEDPLLTYYEICLNEIEGRHRHYSYAYLELFKASAHDDEIAGWIAEFDEQMLELHSALVAAAQKKGQISADIDPEDVVSIFWGLEDGVKLARLTYTDYFTNERMKRLLDLAFDRILGLPEGRPDPSSPAP